jgi:hypothetical protein
MTGEQKPNGRGPSPNSVATKVRERVEAGGERFWKHADFSDLSASAVAHALSRLAATGDLERVGKGLYFRSKQTAIGPSGPPGPGAIEETAKAPLHPSGLTAGSALGFSTQNPAKPEFATASPAAPSLLQDIALVRTRRPHTRLEMDSTDAALLELLRDRALSSDLPPEATVDRLLSLLAEPGRFERLTEAALFEPPRVRAMLGALGERANGPEASLEALRNSLNPLSKFDFGPLGILPNAKAWQAR